MENLLKSALSGIGSKDMKATSSKPDPIQCPTCKTTKYPYQPIPIIAPHIWRHTQCKCEIEKEQQEREREAAVARQERAERLYSKSGLSKRLMACTFESFEKRPGTEKALEAANRYAEMFTGKTEKGLLFIGGYGNGKSHLAAAICHELIKREVWCVFWTVPQLLARIRSTFNQGNQEQEADILRSLRSCNLLVLDDLGTEKVSDWVAETLFVIIDNRYQDMKPVIVTTNCSPKELAEKVGGKTHSRILAMTEGVLVKAGDYRTRHIQGGE